MNKAIVIIACIFLSMSCKKKTKHTGTIKTEDPGIVLKITKPENNSRNIEDSLLQINVDATDTLKKIAKINLYIDNKLIATDNKSPYQFVWVTSPKSLGNHALNAIAFDINNIELENDSLNLIIYDNRLPYLGNFYFTIHKTSYGGVWPVVDTTFYDDGEIRNFSTSDFDNDFCNNITDTIYTNRKISIQFWDNWLVSTAVTESGTFIEKFKNHTYQAGKFSDINNVELTCQDGGLGGGYTYKVSGKRE